MDNAALLSAIQSRFPEAQEPPLPDPKFIRGPEAVQVKIPPAKWVELATHLKNGLGFDLLNFLTAVDDIKEGRFEVVCHLTSSTEPTKAVLIKTDLPRDGQPSLASLALLYSAADWQERETYDLFGIRFEGHPNHRRILLWEGYPGWPLRKDYVHTLDDLDNGSEIGLPKAPEAPASPAVAEAKP